MTVVPPSYEKIGDKIDLFCRLLISGDLRDFLSSRIFAILDFWSDQNSERLHESQPPEFLQGVPHHAPLPAHEAPGGCRVPRANVGARVGICVTGFRDSNSQNRGHNFQPRESWATRLSLAPIINQGGGVITYRPTF